MEIEEETADTIYTIDDALQNNLQYANVYVGNLTLEVTSVDLPGNLRYFSNPLGLKSFGTFNIGEGLKINSCEEVLFDSDTFQASGMETHQSDESSIGYKI